MIYLWTVHFLIVTMGDYFSGSPFHPKVIDPRKVRISGGWAQYMDGNERVGLVVGEEKRLVFDVSQAGPGETMLLPLNIYHISRSKSQFLKLYFFLPLSYTLIYWKMNIMSLAFLNKTSSKKAQDVHFPL